MKKVTALLIVLVLCLSLAACGSTSGGSAGTSASAGTADSAAPASQEPASAEPAGTGEESAEPELKTDTLKIGLLVHTTEWFAAVDMPNYYEFNAMVDYVNTVLGGWQIGDTLYTIEAVNVDGQSDNEALRAGAISLVDAGVQFVVETNDFWVMSCEDIFEDAGVMHCCAYPVYVPGYMGPDNPMAFTASNGAVGDYASAFNVLSEVYPDAKSVVFVNDDNGINELLFGLMSEYGQQYGIEVLDNFIKYPGDTTDYSAIALQIVESGADCFMGQGSPSAYGAILKEVRALGSDIVCACVQGKPASMLMEYAGADASYNAFTLGPSTRESDKAENTDIFNGVVEQVRALYGDDAAKSFDGAACNNLYVLLQAMQKAGSVDPAGVAAAWEGMGTVETIYGTGYTGGETTYAIANHAIGSPRSVSVIDPTAEDGWYFWGWIDVEIP